MDIVRASFNAVILLFIITISSPVYSQQQRKAYSTSVGENITLPCLETITSEVAFLVWWKDGIKILSYTSSVNDAPPAEDKYRRVGNTGTWLEILNLNHSDAGNYICSGGLRNDEFIESDQMELFVTELLVSPCNQDCQNDVDECSCYINGGETSDLSCRTRGFPSEPDITWKFPGNIQLESYRVNLASYSDNMTLVCRAQDAAVLDVTLESDPVCVFYPLQMEATDNPPEKDAVSTNRPQEFDTSSPNSWRIFASCIYTVFGIIIIITYLKRRGYWKDSRFIDTIAESRCIPNCLKNDSQESKHGTNVAETEKSYKKCPVMDSGVKCSTVQNSSQNADGSNQPIT